MSGYRTAVWLKRNKADGTEDPERPWVHIGNTSSFATTVNNSYAFQNTLGSKFYDLATMGRFDASGSFNTIIDYNNFYWLGGILEDYSTSKETVTREGDARTVYAHKFAKSNYKTPHSFTMLVRKMNRMVGGTHDETRKLIGVKFKSFNPSWDNSSGATVPTSVQFSYCNEELVLDDLTDLEQGLTITKHDKRPVEWGCLMIGEGGVYTQIANNEKCAYTYSLGQKAIGECGTRFNADFVELNSPSFTVSNQVYSRKPEQWYLRFYNGGEKQEVGPAGTKYGPRKKHGVPIERMRICSSDTALYQFINELEDVTVENLPYTYNPTSMITESPSIKARKLTIIIKTPDIDKDIYTEEPIA